MIAFILLVVAGAAHAEDLVRGETSRVIDVTDGDTITLDSGTEVRLIGLQAPKLPLGRKGFAPWLMAGDARDMLEALVMDERVTLFFGGAREDRYGRALAQVKRDDELWVQGEMIRLGMARVYSFRDSRTCVERLLVLEGEARLAKRGVWGEDWYRVRAADDTFRELDTFQIIEARIVDTAENRGRIFLNYGSDWRDDFTVTVAPRDTALFEEAGLDLLSLTGERIRVRGWLTYYNGPNMEATHPEQIELIESPDARQDEQSSVCETS